MTDITLNDITSGYKISRMNENFDTLKTSINDTVFHRSGGNNTMSQQIDMNSNKIINSPNATNAQDLITYGQALGIIGGIATGEVATLYERKWGEDGTSGRTVFTLSSITYTFGGDNLAVYCRGVRMEKDIDYTENADGVTVTFLSARAPKDRLLFIRNEIVGSTPGTIDSASVTHTASLGTSPLSGKSKFDERISVADFNVKPGNSVSVNDAGLTAMKTSLPSGSTIYWPRGTYNISQFQWPNKQWHMIGEGRGSTGTRIVGDGTGSTVWGMVTAQAASGSSFKGFSVQAAAGTTDIAIQVGPADGRMHLEDIFCNPDQTNSPFDQGGQGLSVVNGNGSTFDRVIAYGSAYGIDIHAGDPSFVYTNTFRNCIAAVNSTSGNVGTAWSVRADTSSDVDGLCLENCIANGGLNGLTLDANTIRTHIYNFWEENTHSSGKSFEDLSTASVVIACNNWRSRGAGASITYSTTGTVLHSDTSSGESLNQMYRDLDVLRNLDVTGTITGGSTVELDNTFIIGDTSGIADPGAHGNGAKIYQHTGGDIKMRTGSVHGANIRVVCADRAIDAYSITGTPAGTTDVNVTTPNLTTTTEVLASLINTLTAEGIIE